MRKQLFAVLLALCMVFNLLPVGVLADDIPTSGTCGSGVTWSFDKGSGTLTISGEGSMYDYESDEMTPWNSFKEEITSVKIGSGVESIGGHAFHDCINLASVSIPNTVTNIREYAFDYCAKLTDITLPSSISYIAGGAFENIQELSLHYQGTREQWNNVNCTSRDIQLSIIFANGSLLAVSYHPEFHQIIQDDGWASYPLWWDRDEQGQLTIIDSKGVGIQDLRCLSSSAAHLIKSVVVGEGVRHTPNLTNYKNLINISISSTVEDIGYRAFRDCASLQNIKVANGNTSYYDIDGVLFSKKDKCLMQYPLGRSGAYQIPNGTLEIGYSDGSAFSGCSGLTDVTFPTSIQEISFDAFDGTPWLEKQGDFAIANGILFRYLGSAGGKTVTIPENVTYIGPRAFDYLNDGNPESVVVPASVKKIGSTNSGTGGLAVGPFNDGSRSVHHVTILGKDTEINCLWSYDNGGWGSWGDEWIDPMYIHGYTGSTAEAYAKNHNATFIALDQPTITFADVPSGEYYADAVNWAVSIGVTNGTGSDEQGNNYFSPADSCTRAQAVTFLWRAAGSPEPNSTNNPFADVSSGEYYYKAVLWAVEKGITNGISETAFDPNATCNRAQIVTFLHRYEGSPAASGSSFNDVPAGEYYYAPVIWAVSKGVTNGTGDGNFSPMENCTRGQIVTFLYRDMVG